MAFDCKIRGIKRMSLGFLLFFLLAAAIPAQQADLQPIAMVKLDKNEPITLAQLKTRVAAYEKELGTSMTPQQRQEVLDTLINERLVVQAAEKEASFFSVGANLSAGTISRRHSSVSFHNCLCFSPNSNTTRAGWELNADGVCKMHCPMISVSFSSDMGSLSVSS